MNMFADVLLDPLLDCLKLLPFLFLTYFLMELLEHRAGEKMNRSLQKAGDFGPAIGGLLGAVPQCGFSAAAASLYAGGVVSAGTLLAVFLSTSDEMIPVFLSHQVGAGLVVRVLAWKVGLGMAFGFLFDGVLRLLKKKGLFPVRSAAIEDLCEQEHCHCEGGSVLGSAVRHTLHIMLFLFLILLCLNLVTELAGLERLEGFLSGGTLRPHLLAALVGLIPNCAASVFLTEMYLGGVLPFSAMISGLLVGAGVGLLVLFRTNASRRENGIILGVLYVCGVAGGLFCSLFV